jgi:hypothetical protein
MCEIRKFEAEFSHDKIFCSTIIENEHTGALALVSRRNQRGLLPVLKVIGFIAIKNLKRAFRDEIKTCEIVSTRIF